VIHVYIHKKKSPKSPKTKTCTEGKLFSEHISSAPAPIPPVAALLVQFLLYFNFICAFTCAFLFFLLRLHLRLPLLFTAPSPAPPPEACPADSPSATSSPPASSTGRNSKYQWNGSCVFASNHLSNVGGELAQIFSMNIVLFSIFEKFWTLLCSVHFLISFKQFVLPKNFGGF